VPDVNESGLKLVLTPAGDVALRVTVPVKPPVGVIVAVYVVLEAAVMEREPGETDRVKFCTTSVTDVVRVRLPLVPVIVTV
jgi:hypothetical protein